MIDILGLVFCFSFFFFLLSFYLSFFPSGWWISFAKCVRLCVKNIEILRFSISVWNSFLLLFLIHSNLGDALMTFSIKWNESYKRTRQCQSNIGSSPWTQQNVLQCVCVSVSECVLGVLSPKNWSSRFCPLDEYFCRRKSVGGGIFFLFAKLIRILSSPSSLFDTYHTHSCFSWCRSLTLSISRKHIKQHKPPQQQRKRARNVKYNFMCVVLFICHCCACALQIVVKQSKRTEFSEEKKIHLLHASVKR